MKAWGVAYRAACGSNTAGCLFRTGEMLKKAYFFRSRRKIREVLEKNALCEIAHVFAHAFEELLTLLTFLLTLEIWRYRKFFVISPQEAGRLSIGTDFPADN